jgi:glutamate-1-semialdehyde aminotransferase
MPSENYLKEVRKICDENQLLLIFDEVQTGLVEQVIFLHIRGMVYYLTL